MPIVLVLLLILGAGLVIAGLWLPRLGPDPVQAYVSQLTPRSRPRSLEQLELQQPLSERLIRPALQQLARHTQRFSRNRGTRRQEQATGAIQRRLTLAGNPYRWTPTDFLGVKAFGALLAASLVLVPSLVAGQLLSGILFGAGAGLIGFMLPELYLIRLTRQRQKEIQQALPQFLDILAVCLEAGIGFDGAVVRTCQKSDNALTREFARMLQDLRVGRPRREALRGVIARTQVPDLAKFIHAIIQADELGFSLSRVLAIQADEMRTTRRQRAEEEAAQAPIKMLIPMAIFIFPSICTVVLGPLWPALARSGSAMP